MEFEDREAVEAFGAVVWENDLSESYDVDDHLLVQNADGFHYVRATGCSCWEGDYWLEQSYPSITAAQDPVSGVPANVRNPAFEAL